MDWVSEVVFKEESTLPSSSNEEDPLLDEKPINLYDYGNQPHSDDSDNAEVLFNLSRTKSLWKMQMEDDIDQDNINAVEEAMDDEADCILGVSTTFTWEKDFKNFKGGPETFSGATPGPIKDFDKPYDSFIEIWDLNFIECIAQETNRYANQTINELKSKETMKPSSRLHQWTPTDANEIMVLFAIFMYMGIAARTSQNEYWQSNDFLELTKFKQLMTYARFVLLSKFLHFVDNNDEKVVKKSLQNEALSPKLAKLGPVVTYLNSKFSTVYNLDRDITIDKSLTFFKGRLSDQDKKTKGARCVIKSYELCESRTGYLYKFQIYTGKESASATAPTNLGRNSTKVVLDLLKGLKNLGHCVTMDNCYNCPALARYLKSLGFDCVGTLLTNRRHVPDDIAMESNVANGTVIARHCGDVSVLTWKDSKLITTISTYHKDNTCVGKRAGKTLVKPVVVRDYSNAMIGVDQRNQKLAMYLLERKGSVKWYIKMFKRLLNVSIHNAYVMYVSSLKRRQKRSMTHREFRYCLAKSLIDKHHARLPEANQSVGQLMRLRRDVMHVPKYESGRNNRKRCQVCYRRQINKMVRTQCVTCNVFLCFGTCWIDWHSSEDLEEARSRRKRCIDECR